MLTFARAGGRMRHNEFDREFSCDGELIETQESIETVEVCFCGKCLTEFRAKALTSEERKEIATKASMAAAKKRKEKAAERKKSRTE